MGRYLLKDDDSKRQIGSWFRKSLRQYGRRSDHAWAEEDALCESFMAAISGAVETPAGRIEVTGHKVRGRGSESAEGRLGADGLGLVRIHTSDVNLDGFFLFQAKKAETKKDPLHKVRAQCTTMLSHTAASHLLVLMRHTVVVAGAMAVRAASVLHPSLRRIPYVSFTMFVVEQLLRGLMLAPLEEAGGTHIG
jgi:hypothetical protein